MAIVPSPAPKRPRRIWRVVVLVVALLILVFGAAVAAVIGLGIPWAEDQVVVRLRSRLRAAVEVESVKLDWGRVSLSGVEIAGGDGEPSISLQRVDVDLDVDALWSGRAEVTAVTIEGGRLQGERSEFEDFVRRLREGRRPGASTGRGRVRLRPRTISLVDVWLVASEARADGAVRRLETRISAEVDVEQRQVAVSANDVIADTGLGPTVRARSVSTTLSAQTTEGGYAVTFPIRAQLRGVAAPISEDIAVAGADGWVEVSDAEATEISVDVAGAFGEADKDVDPAEKLWSVAGRVHRDLSEGVLRVDMDDFALSRVPPQVLERLPLVESGAATAGGHLAVVFGDGVAALEGDLTLEGLGVSSPLLARRPVRDIGFEVSFAAEVDPRARRAVLHYVDVEREGVKVSVSATIEHPERKRGRRYDIVLDVPRVPCQSVLTAVPDGLAPGLAGFRLGGDIDAHVEAHVDFADLETLSLGGTVAMERCEVLATPAPADAARLAGGFTHRVLMKDGGTASVQMYPGARGFASIHQISPYVTAAIRSTEDGGFWRHNGFMPSQFEVALRRNLAAGRVRLGASTITMQMVKNVLLGHERTLSRKFQELVLTWYVEKVLSKDRIMELYLNAIEYGPGIYGIVAAANYYFGKHPADLDPIESVYLALMLPSPVRRSAHYCNGELSPRFAVKVARILRLMNERGRLSDLEYELWKETELVFDLRKRGSEGACHGRIKRMREGTFTQMPMGGLLAPEEFIDDAPPPVHDGPAGGPGAVDLEQLPGSEDPAEVDDLGTPAMDTDG